MAELEGNLLVAQSGGPTSVINASLSGVVQEAGKHMCIEEIYGGLNGVHGILREELVDFNEETNAIYHHESDVQAFYPISFWSVFHLVIFSLCF